LSGGGGRGTGRGEKFVEMLRVVRWMRCGMVSFFLRGLRDGGGFVVWNWRWGGQAAGSGSRRVLLDVVGVVSGLGVAWEVEML
jgi:hypothetical protein